MTVRLGSLIVTEDMFSHIWGSWGGMVLERHNSAWLKTRGDLQQAKVILLEVVEPAGRLL